MVLQFGSQSIKLLQVQIAWILNLVHPTNPAITLFCNEHYRTKLLEYIALQRFQRTNQMAIPPTLAIKGLDYILN